MNTTIKLTDHSTGKLLAEIPAKDLNKWCDANGKLPHHKTRTGWAVI